MLRAQQVRRVLQAPLVGRVLQGPPVLLALQEQPERQEPQAPLEPLVLVFPLVVRPTKC